MWYINAPSSPCRGYLPLPRHDTGGVYGEFTTTQLNTCSCPMKHSNLTSANQALYSIYQHTSSRLIQINISHISVLVEMTQEVVQSDLSAISDNRTMHAEYKMRHARRDGYGEIYWWNKILVNISYSQTIFLKQSWDRSKHYIQHTGY